MTHYDQREHSMLTFESNQSAGVANIVEKLVSLPFTTVQHRVTTLDAQPASQTEAAMIVLVTGQLIVSDSYLCSLQLILISIKDGRRSQRAQLFTDIPSRTRGRRLLRVQ